VQPFCLEFAPDRLDIIDFEGDMSDPAFAIIELLQNAAFVRKTFATWAGSID
jgi:hypothetical protein